MVKRLFACLGAALIACPAVAMAYYEESLSPSGGVSEVEIVSQGSPISSMGIEVREINETAPQSGGLVSYVGKGKARTVSGRAKGLPLNLTLPMVAPKGWKIEYSGDSADKRVSFNARNRPWTLVVEDMSRATSVPMVIDWSRNAISVGRSGVRTMAQAPQGADETQPRKFSGGIVKKAVISQPGRADEVARRYKVKVDDFCQWNMVGPSAWLATGYEVYLQAPPEGTIVVANIPASPTDPMAGKKLPPVVKPSVATSPAEPVQAAFSPEEDSFRAVPASSDFIYALHPGQLSIQLMDWCTHAGYELVWKVADDYEITSYSGFGPDFKKSLTMLFNSLMDSGEPLRATVYERNHIVEVNAE